jgi:hypothetical protein
MMLLNTGVYMLKNIYLPLSANNQSYAITQVHISAGQRVRKGQALLHYKLNNQQIPLACEHDGWVRFVATKPNDSLDSGSLLAVIDIVDVTEYRPDDNEFNPHTELGETGRRGLERAGQREFTNGYAGELFDAPTEQHGQRQRSVKEHPLLHQMKEGVPPKMSNARNNQPATERLAENASTDPELANQLSLNLQAQLDVTPGPSSAPGLTRG